MTESKRTINEMLDLYGLPKELYTMQRAVAWKGELRKDVIIMPSLVINGQFNKTHGHIHSTGHAELYHVLKGEALFFIQKGNRNEIKDCICSIVKAGQSIVLPADYYHITVNVGEGELKMYNWVSDKSVSAYRFIVKMKGMCYYFYSGKIITAMQNPNYKKVPKIRHIKPLEELPKDLSFLL